MNSTDSNSDTINVDGHIAFTETDEKLQSNDKVMLRLDRGGLALMPQPTAFKDDPLVS